MYLTNIYLKNNVKNLGELYKTDQEFPEEKGIDSFMTELRQCITADTTKQLDELSEPLLSWFIEEGHLYA